MDAHLTHTIRLFFTPNELFKLGDDASFKLLRGKIGDDLIVREICIGDVCVKIFAYQE